MAGIEYEYRPVDWDLATGNWELTARLEPSGKGACHGVRAGGEVGGADGGTVGPIA